MEWLDITWDQTFQDVYAIYKWATFGLDTGGEQSFYIVTELDPLSCATPVGSEMIPQSFWALRFETYL